MKILPLITVKIKSLTNHKNRIKPAFVQGHDTVELSSKQPFEHLTLSTFKKLQKIKFTPEKLNGYHSTFVIDKLTGKPVTVFIKLLSDNSNGCERYELYVKKLMSKGLKCVGSRNFRINKLINKITSGYMESYKGKRYRGLGIREHQIAIERMKQENVENVTITSLPEAGIFHRKCGFIRNEVREMELSKDALTEWNRFINSGQKIFND